MGKNIRDNKKIIFSDNSLWGLLNFRGEIIRRFLARDYEVVLVAPREDSATPASATPADPTTPAAAAAISRNGDDSLPPGEIPAGALYVPVDLSRTGTTPLGDARYFLALCKIYRTHRPDHIFHYTIKPNIYGTLAARLLGIRSTAMIAGVGHVFTRSNVKNRIARVMYRIAMHLPEQVLVLNAANRDTLLERRVVPRRKLLLLPGGEGVDLDRFTPLPMPSNPKPVFLMICRLLYEKGYAEYVAAAEALAGKAEFRVMGPLDSHPAAVRRQTLQHDVDRGVIRYIAPSPDVSAQVAQVDCIVLPSWGEGLSRVLMEGAAMGRPLIASDIAGCREAIDEGVNGYLVAPKSAAALISAFEKFIALTPAARARMGRASRRIAEQRFSLDKVWEVYKRICGE
jgi:glycosyltransferase involved in cell wall biosynthesis